MTAHDDYLIITGVVKAILKTAFVTASHKVVSMMANLFQWLLTIKPLKQKGCHDNYFMTNGRYENCHNDNLQYPLG